MRALIRIACGLAMTSVWLVQARSQSGQTDSNDTKAAPIPPQYITRTLPSNEGSRCANAREYTDRMLQSGKVLSGIAGMFATGVSCPSTPIYQRPDGTFGTGTAAEIAEEQAQYERFRLKLEADRAAEERRHEAQQQAATAEAEKKRRAQATQGKANPSPALLEYEATMRPFQINFGIAYAAGICQLRSDRYFTIFREARQLIYENERQRHRLSAAEWAVADADMTQVLSDVLSRIGTHSVGGSGINLITACQKLANGPELDQLDVVERKLTGNYH